ncbi:MAG TPA: RsbRD N-terminal domain-containing protein [Pyrinomonadaceae bacterium]|nr:RsbRD N-terminal domain-containing protein [Pyrinomonadaceae bacterium]
MLNAYFMPERFAPLLREQTDALTREWVDGVYADRRTDLPVLLSYRELVEHLPELFEELGALLDRRAAFEEIVEAARRLRFHAQVRFQQGCLVDEVARELTILRIVLTDFLWREGAGATEGDIWELRDALRRTDIFVDELLTQAVLIYASCLRPSVPTRTSVWPPPRRRRTDFAADDERK